MDMALSMLRSVFRKKGKNETRKAEFAVANLYQIRSLDAWTEGTKSIGEGAEGFRGGDWGKALRGHSQDSTKRRTMALRKAPSPAEGSMATLSTIQGLV